MSKLANKDLKLLEIICKDIGMTSTQYKAVTGVVDKMLRHMAQEISDETLKWNNEDLLKQQEETKREKLDKTGIWRE